MAEAGGACGPPASFRDARLAVVLNATIAWPSTSAFPFASGLVSWSARSFWNRSALFLVCSDERLFLWVEQMRDELGVVFHDLRPEIHDLSAVPLGIAARERLQPLRKPLGFKRGVVEEVRPGGDWCRRGETSFRHRGPCPHAYEVKDGGAVSASATLRGRWSGTGRSCRRHRRPARSPYPPTPCRDHPGPEARGQPRSWPGYQRASAVGMRDPVYHSGEPFRQWLERSIVKEGTRGRERAAAALLPGPCGRARSDRGASASSQRIRWQQSAPRSTRTS